ncbi:MAG: hypothetical protein ACREJB_13410, partial [Planctomycetaceae bacterium]
MTWFALVTTAVSLTIAASDTEPAGPTVIVVTGAGGAPEYAEQFAAWAERWETAAHRGRCEVVRIGTDRPGGVMDRDRLRHALEEQDAAGDRPLWIVLIGHGTFDGRAARFNLSGPDVAAAELKSWLARSTRPVAVINCASASAPFLTTLSAPNRVVVTATKSGHEQNFARFGESLSTTIADSTADLDKDGQTSLLEAFLVASRRTEEFYQTEGRLPTEHALLDDNGDGRGIRADWFRGVRPITEAAGASPDGHRAHQWHLVPSEDERRMPPDLRRRRDELEL